tara:strand:- start:316 stop:600 length:285 start_codon:yes stop_codon:yes gene_type:complete
MLYYLVIGICIFLLLVVIFISAKPISMGIEARRNLNEKASKTKLDVDIFEKDQNVNLDNNLSNISDEIIKLNKLRNDGVLTEEEYEKAKKKLLG